MNLPDMATSGATLKCSPAKSTSPLLRGPWPHHRTLRAAIVHINDFDVVVFFIRALILFVGNQ